MRSVPISLIAATVLLGGCSDSTGRAEAGTNEAAAAASAVSVANTPAATSSGIAALGLTMDQLGDADLLDASGIEIGEVERVITDASGAVTNLLIEIEDMDPDRYVTIPLTGLTVAREGDDQDLRSSLTRQELLAMPAEARR